MVLSCFEWYGSLCNLFIKSSEPNPQTVAGARQQAAVRLGRRMVVSCFVWYGSGCNLFIKSWILPLS